jgi:hypothetical protein
MVGRIAYLRLILGVPMVGYLINLRRIKMQVYPPEQYISSLIIDRGLRSVSGYDDFPIYLKSKSKKPYIPQTFNFKTKKQYTGIIGFIMNLLGRNPEVM